MKLAFIFSLPRSGSTLLQKIVASNHVVATQAEPWFLLPLLYGGNPEDYDSTVADKAIAEFMATLPDDTNTELGTKDIGRYAEYIYTAAASASPQAELFVDKTPRYYYIIDQIAATFPEAKLVFLFRNPVSIIASTIKTWHSGKLNLPVDHPDIQLGAELLAAGYQKYKSRSHRVQYSDIITNPQATVQRLCEYVEIEYSSAMVHDFNQQNFSGSMGDPNIAQTQAITTGSLTSWQKTLDTSIRRKFAWKCIQRWSDETVAEFGYTRTQLRHQLFDDDVRKASVKEWSADKYAMRKASKKSQDITD